MRFIHLSILSFIFLSFIGCVSKKEKETIATVDSLVQVREFEKALNILTSAIHESPKSKPLQRRRITLFLKADRVDLAVAAYREFVQVISKGKSPSQDAILRDSLRDKDPMIRGNAARALSTLSDSDAFSSIAKLVKDPENEVRRSAVYALGDLKDDRAVEPLIEALKDSWWFVRSDAAQALGRLRDVKAVPPLFLLLEDPDAQVQHAATNALLTLVKENKPEEYLAQLKNSNPKHVEVATFSLATIRNRESLPQLLVYLSTGRAEIRPLAMRVIGQMQDSNTISVVRQGLQDKDPAVRHEAIIALVELQDTGSIETLKSMATKGGEDQVIRQLAARAADRLFKIVPTVKP